MSLAPGVLSQPGMAVWFQTLGSVLAVSAASLVAVMLLAGRDRLRWLSRHLVALAVGALYGDAFFHLLPEAVGRWGVADACALTLGGLLFFFVVEKAVRRGLHDRRHHARPVASMNLIGDALHNAIDGLVIGGSYAVDAQLGMTTTVAVLLHEIPQELGDFGVLVHGGLPAGRALRWNALVSLAAVVGGIVGVLLGDVAEALADAIVPVTAGAFVYLAGSDLVPELHGYGRGARVAMVQLVLIVAGIAMMAVAA
jgi:zinc and cadmium transporter